jgi:hypothetical protein
VCAHRLDHHRIAELGRLSVCLGGVGGRGFSRWQDAHSRLDRERAGLYAIEQALHDLG